MYEKRFTQILKETVEGLQVKYNSGEIFWVNNSTIPSVTLTNLAAGLSNERVCFKGVTKTGISELMAVHHRVPQSPYKLTSSLLGIVTDSVVRRQQKHAQY